MHTPPLGQTLPLPPSRTSTSNWHAQLHMQYGHQDGRTFVHHQHQGPLRILQSLYPEGDAVCHNVLVHPPGGLVGGDVMDIDVQVHAQAHGLVTTPGATRFYRCDTGKATQHVNAYVAEHGRLEWLPLETIAYNGCRGTNQAVFELAPGAEMMTWDITALGLPHASQPFDQGQLQQHLEIKGVWLERGLLDAQDMRLMDSPLGLAKHRCMATLVLACGTDLHRARRDVALSLARELIDVAPVGVVAGATSPHPRVVVVRALSPIVEPAQTLLRAIWAAWRRGVWAMSDTAPRIWSQ